MTQTGNLCLLEEFTALLLEEKDVLIKNKREDLQAIVKQKEKLADQLQELTLSEEEHKLLLPMLQEIRTLQETNLVLTQQSLEFVDAFLEAIHTETKKQSVTYSKKGAYETKQETAFLDQSL